TKKTKSSKSKVRKQCTECGLLVLDLSVHSRVHLGVKPFQCDLCDSRFGSPFRLKRHKAGVHEKKRNFICPLCGYSFMQKSEYEVHMRVHQNDRPFECDICHRRFVTSSKLKYHSRSHTGEKPFPCPHCDAKLSRNQYLTDHLRTRHGIIKPKRVYSKAAVTQADGSV
ncbi:unnamed protein product, partial [Cyprideis torosa]